MNILHREEIEYDIQHFSPPLKGRFKQDNNAYNIVKGDLCNIIGTYIDAFGDKVYITEYNNVKGDWLEDKIDLIKK